MKHFLCVILGSGSYKYCAESFLFSLVNPSGTELTKMPLKGTTNLNGIFCNSGYGPTFGGGNDLYIATVSMKWKYLCLKPTKISTMYSKSGE